MADAKKGGKRKWTDEEIQRALSEPMPEWLEEERAEDNRHDAGFFAIAMRHLGVYQASFVTVKKEDKQ